MKRLLALVFLGSGCASVPSDALPLSGEWGGAHVALHLTPTGGTIDYDCAHGTIGPIILRADGSFTAEGTHAPEHGGPVRQGEVLPSWPTRYDGRASGERMTLRGITSNDLTLGPFELRRGAEPEITRCL